MVKIPVFVTAPPACVTLRSVAVISPNATVPVLPIVTLAAVIIPAPSF